MISTELPEGFREDFAVVGCFLEHAGNILMIKRHPDKAYGSLWGLPSGKVDKGETLQQAMRREIREEIGLNVSEEKLVYLGTSYVNHPHIDISYSVFKTEMSTSPVISLKRDENVDFRWMTAEDSAKLEEIVPHHDDIVRIFYRK